MLGAFLYLLGTLTQYALTLFVAFVLSAGLTYRNQYLRSGFFITIDENSNPLSKCLLSKVN